MRLLPEMRQVPLKDRELFNGLFFLSHFIRGSGVIAGWKDKVRRRIAERLRRGGPGKVIPVQRLKSLSPEDFREHFLRTGRPVIFDKAAAGWPCSARWSFDSFKQRFGHETIKLVQQKGLSDDEYIGDAEYSEEINFGDFLDQVLGGGMRYMRFSPLLERFPELLDDFDQAFLQGMPNRTLGSAYLMFIGGTGTVTRLHNEPQPFFSVNVIGIKRWTLIPNHYLAALNPHASGLSHNHSDARVDQPDPKAFPGFEAIDRMEAVLEPGDVLYVPTWMWHTVKNETPTIGVRCSFFHPRSMVEESPVLFFNRLFGARNPTVWEALYYSLIKTDLHRRSRRLVIPKIFRYRQVDGAFIRRP